MVYTRVFVEAKKLIETFTVNFKESPNKLYK